MCESYFNSNNEFAEMPVLCQFALYNISIRFDHVTDRQHTALHAYTHTHTKQLHFYRIPCTLSNVNVISMIKFIYIPRYKFYININLLKNAAAVLISYSNLILAILFILLVQRSMKNEFSCRINYSASTTNLSSPQLIALIWCTENQTYSRNVHV